MKKLKKLCTSLLSLFMIGSVLTATACNCNGNNGAPLTEEEIVTMANTVIGKFTERKVDSVEDAILAVKDIAKDLQLENAVEELTAKSTNTVDDLTYYRLQQNYKGIPVYGSTMVVVSDENGDTKGVTGNAVKIKKDISLKPTITQEEVKESIRKNYGDVLANNVPNLTSDNLAIYITDENQNGRLTYVLPINTNVVIIDAQTAEIISNSNYFKEAMVGDGLLDFKVSFDGNQYALYDEERNIKVYSLENVNSQETKVDSNGQEIVTYDWGKYNTWTSFQYITSPDEIFGNTLEEKTLEYDKATTLYRNGIGIYDYFNNLADNFSMPPIYLYYNDMFDGGLNALGGTVPTDQGDFSAVMMGSLTGVEKVDVIAHEFTHMVTGSIVNWTATSDRLDYAGAINEAYSDIFGVIIEAEINGWDEPDWIFWEGNSGQRSLKSPSTDSPIVCFYEFYSQDCPLQQHIWNKNYTLVEGETCSVKLKHPNNANDKSYLCESKYDDGGVHHNSTIISHAAYLMTQGKNALTIDELAQLWYNTLYVIPSNCTFDALRQNMLMIADSLDYTEQQKKRISSAFDSVGIDGLEESGATAIEIYSTKSTLQVYGEDMELYDDYIIDIIKSGNDKSENRHVEVKNTKPVNLNLSEGKYTITIRDGKNKENRYNKNIRISRNSADSTIVFATNFGHSHTYISIGEKVSTCQINGWIKYECECGESKEETLPLIDHNYVNGICSMCGEQEEIYVPPVLTDPIILTQNGIEIQQGDGLTLTWQPPISPTSGVSYFIAIMDANNNYAYTEVTKDWINQTSYQIDASFFPHTGTYVISLYAKADGLGQSEAAINIFIKEKEEVSIPCSHDWILVMGQMPTCSHYGMVSHYYCRYCDSYALEADNIVDRESLLIPALDHVCIDPSRFCSNTVTCDHCGTQFEIDNPTPAPHKYGDDGICKFCGEKKSAEATEGVLYRLSDDGTYAEVYGYEGIATEVMIADTYEGKPVISIGYYAFTKCSSLTSITIPDTVTSISKGAFRYCSSLTSITIPDSVTSIGDSAFSGCSSLTSIKVDENNTNYTSLDGNLYNKDKTLLIQYAIGKTTTYFTIPDTVASIGYYAFNSCSSLTSISIPDSVTSISEGAFNGCSSLTSVTIPDSVTSIGQAAFYNCSSLTSVTIPDSVTKIYYSVFVGCSSLTSVTIGNSIRGIYDTFAGCSSLTSMTIGNSVRYISARAFRDCISLTEIKFEGTTTQWNAIEKESFWNNDVPAKKVICSDGEVEL